MSSFLQAFKKLTTFFKSLGVKAVFDTSCSRDLALIEACNEFVVRYKQSQASNEKSSKTSLPMISSACPGIHCVVPLSDPTSPLSPFEGKKEDSVISINVLYL